MTRGLELGGLGVQTLHHRVPQQALPCSAWLCLASEWNGLNGAQPEQNPSFIHCANKIPISVAGVVAGSGEWALGSDSGTQNSATHPPACAIPTAFAGADGPSTRWGFHGFHAASCWFWSCFCCFQTAAESELAVPRHGKSRRCLESGGERPGGRNVRQPTPPAGWQRALTLAVSQLNRPISLLQRFADDCFHLAPSNKSCPGFA